MPDELSTLVAGSSDEDSSSLAPPEATDNDVDTRLNLPGPPIEPPEKPALAYKYLKCALCGRQEGTFHKTSPGVYHCTRCSGDRKPRVIKCPKCGKTLLQQTEKGGSSISGSLKSKGGKIMLTCSCGGKKRVRGGRI